MYKLSNKDSNHSDMILNKQMAGPQCNQVLWLTKYLGEEAVTVTEAQANISDQDVEQATLQSVILLFQICNRSQLM